MSPAQLLRASPALLCLFPALAAAQSTLPAVFVCNNGNLRGSASSYRVNPDGTVALIQELVIGVRASSDPAIRGTNAYAISLTPTGRFLAVSHATSFTDEQITIISVASDATLALHTTFITPGSPLDLAWLDDTTLAVTQTASSGPNFVHVYRFTEAAHSVAQIDVEDTGIFNSRLLLSPDRRWLFAPDSPTSGGDVIRIFSVGPDSRLTFSSLANLGGYPLGPCITPDASHFYSCGGISSGGHRVDGFHFDNQAGTLTLDDVSPYFSAGSSPKEAVTSPDGHYLIVGHGTDSTIRVFAIDPDSGAPTDTGHLFDVGAQGTLGELATLSLPGLDLLFCTDRDQDATPRGLCSFVINPDGSLTERSLRIDSGGVSPNDIASWPGLPQACGSADFDGDGDTATDFDILAFFACIAGNCCPTCGSADFDHDGDTATDFDIQAFFRVLGGGSC